MSQPRRLLIIVLAYRWKRSAIRSKRWLSNPSLKIPTKRRRKRARKKPNHASFILEGSPWQSSIVPATRRMLLPANPQACSTRSEEHTSELQSQFHLVCRLLLEKKKNKGGSFNGCETCRYGHSRLDWSVWCRLR